MTGRDSPEYHVESRDIMLRPLSRLIALFAALAACLATARPVATQPTLRFSAHAHSLLRLDVDGQTRQIPEGSRLVPPGSTGAWGMTLTAGTWRCSRVASMTILSDTGIDPALETLVINISSGAASSSANCGNFSAVSGPNTIELLLWSSASTPGMLLVEGESTDSRSNMAVDVDADGAYDLTGYSIHGVYRRQLQPGVPCIVRVRTETVLQSRGRDTAGCQLRVSLRHGIPMVSYGQGCTPPGTREPFRTVGWARLGEVRFENTVNLAPLGRPILVLGDRVTDSPIIGSPCRLRTNILAMLPAPESVPFRHVRVPYPAAASGASFSAQWIYATGGPVPVVTSNGVGIVLP